MSDTDTGDQTRIRTQAEKRAQSRPKFVDWLAEHRNGLADADIAEALDEVVEAVLRIGGKAAGTVTLTLKVATQGDMIAITDVVKAAVPEEREARLYWRDLNGNLTRNNPLQPSLLDD